MTAVAVEIIVKLFDVIHALISEFLQKLNQLN